MNFKTSPALLALVVFFAVGAKSATHLWTGTSGQLKWSDPGNWASGKVPDSSDQAQIVTSGTYDVLVDQDTTVASLTIGSGKAGIRLVVSSGASLTVTANLEALCPTVLILGSLNVTTFSWSGQYLDGSQTSGFAAESAKGRVTVNSLSLVKRGLYDQKYIRNLVWTNRANFTIDPSMDSSSRYIYCRACRIVNEASASMLFNQVRLNQNGQPVPNADGFTAGIVNRGLLVFETSSYVYVYWDFLNLVGGKVKVVGKNYRSIYSMYFYGRWINDGVVQMYGVSPYFYSSSSNFAGKRPVNGTWEMYSYPFRTSHLANPIGQNSPWTWKQYLADVYQNASYGYWDPQYPVYFRIQNQYSKTLQFYNLTAFGRVFLQVSSSRNVRIEFDGDLNMGLYGEIKLEQYSSNPGSTNNKNVLSVGGDASFSADFVSVGNGWTVDLVTEGAVRVNRRLTVKEGSYVRIGRSDVAMAQFGSFVGVKSTGRFELQGRNATIDGKFLVDGTVNLTQANVAVTEEWQFRQGSLVGSQSSLNLLKIGNITDTFTKTIDGIEIYVEAAKASSNQGVITEYFQYRVDTDRTSRINNLYYFPGEGSQSYSLPQEFKVGSTEPNIASIASSFNRLPRNYGSSPLTWQSDFESYDTNSPNSFTYNYAARLWSFLEIDVTGSYSFYFSTGYALHVQLWINGKAVFTSRRYRYFLSGNEVAGPFTIQKGLRRIRIDFIQESSYWSRRNALVVNYSGPSFSSKPLPTDKLFFRQTHQNGTVEYANPSFNVSRFLPTESVLYVGGTGLIFAKNGANVVIGKTGVMDVHDDITWFSHSAFGQTSKVVNSGKMIKSGDDGVATFFADYSSRGGSLITYKGLMEFKDATKDGGLAVWNNVGGGSWADPNNWVPNRVPRSSDVVHITADGAYQVVIPGHSNLTVLSLTLGSATSQPELIVGHFAELTVTDRLDINAQTTTINGRVTAKYVVFRGETIRGSSFGGEMQIQANLAIIKGLYGVKYLRKVNVTVNEKFDIDSSLDSSNSRMYCDNCYLINGAGSTFTGNRMRLYVQGPTPSAQSDGFRVGLINHGLVVFVVSNCCPYVYWDIRNYGRVVFITNYLWNINSFYLYGSFANYNLTQIYMTNLYLYSQSQVSSGPHGLWQVFSYPMRYSNAPRPVGEQKPGEWRRYLDDVFQNVTNPRDPYVLWNPSYQTSFRVQSQYGSSTSVKKLTFQRMETYGYVEFQVSSSRYVELQFAGGFEMGQHGVLRLQKYSSSSSGGMKILVGDGKKLETGRAYIQKDWNVTVGSRGRATFHRYVTVFEDGVFGTRNGSGTTVDFYGQLIVRQKAIVEVANCATTCHGNVSLSGSFHLGDGSLTTLGRFDIFEGSVFGKSGKILPYGGLNVTGDSDKTFSGVFINIAPPPEYSSSKNGILAEYFQYRVSTDVTTRINNLYYFPGKGSSSYALPSSFDQESSIPNVIRFEKDVSRFPLYYGNSPLFISPSGDPDTNHPMSFTYNYAARLWTFLKIDKAGDYTFYFIAGYSLSYRLWVDDVLKIGASRRYISFLNEQKAGPYTLSAGYHHLRIDFLQESSYWSSYGNTLQVSYSGPGIEKRILPSNELFYHNGTSYSKPGYQAVKKNYGWLAGEGLILGRQAVTVDICSTCELQVLDDVLWYSDSKLGGVTSFVNSGLLVRRGLPGTAAIYGSYVGKPGSSQRTDNGFLEFRDAGVSGGLAIWANPNGGSWNDAANWNPARLPRPGDVVHITLAGSYQVTIPDYVTVNVTSISVGSSRSDVEFVIESFGKLYVSDRLGVHSTKMTLKGFAEVNKMTWTGQYLDGPSPPANRGHLVVLNSMILSRGSFSSKYIRYLRVDNKGNLTIDQLFGSSSDYLYCNNCTVYNYGTYSATAVRHYLNQAPSPSPDDGFRCGLINYGVFVMELGIAGNSYSYWYWDVRNYGNFSLIQKQWRNTGTIYFYATIANYGRLYSYMMNWYVYSSSYLPKGNGSMETFAFPMRYDTLPTPVFSNQRGNWRKYLDDIYGNVTAWDIRYQCTIRISGIYDKDMHFNNLTFHGYTRFDIQSTRNSRFFFWSLLEFDDSSQFTLTKYSSVNDNNRVTMGQKAQVKIGRMRIGQGWSVSVEKDCVFNAGGRLLIEEGSQLNFSTGQDLTFNESVKISLSGELKVTGRTVIFKSDLSLSGQVHLTNSTASVEGNLKWDRGVIKGIQNGKVQLRMGCDLSGNLLKTLDGLNVEIAAEKVGVRHGIVAEYFQYRFTTSVTMKINNLYYFPGKGSSSYALPSEFDLPATKGNVVRFESSLHRQTKTYGRAPIAYQSDGWSYDSNSVDSFTYNYAARLWAFLKIDQTGFYRFFFTSGYGMHVRLSFNGTVHYISGRYIRVNTEETSPKIQLSAGMVLMRIDYIQESSYWSTEGGYLSVKYQGPGIAKQLIPDDRLYAVRDKGKGDLEPAAVNMKLPKDYQVCKSSLSFDKLAEEYPVSVSHCKLSGTGAVLTQNAVNLTIDESGILDLATDTDWPKAHGGSQTQLTVNGMIVKSSGSGTVNLNTVYSVNSDSGCVKSLSGKLELGRLEGTTSSAAPATANPSVVAPQTIQPPVQPSPPPGVLLTWKGNSGQWDDPNHWSQRVPNVNDDVRIAASSSDEITINGIVVIKTLDVSSGHLIIAAAAQVNVTDQFLYSSSTLSVYGSLTVAEFVWSGENLFGATSSGSAFSQLGRLTVEKKMLVQRGSNGYKKIYDIDVYIQKNFTVEPSLENSAYLQCGNCRLINAFSSTMTLTGLNLQYTATSNERGASSDGFRRGLINNGTVIVTPVQQSPQWQWDLRNYGRIVLVNLYYRSQRTLSLYYSVLINLGHFESYACSVSMSNIGRAKDNGTWTLRSLQAAYINTYSTIPGYQTPRRYKEYIKYIFQNETYEPKIWDMTQTITFSFRNYISTDVWFANLKTYGRVRVYVSSCRHTRVIFAGHLSFSLYTEIQLGYTSSSSSYTNTSLVVEDSVREATFGSVQVFDGHDLHVPSGVSPLDFWRLSVAGGSANINASFTVVTDLTVSPDGTLQLRGGNVTVGATFVPLGKTSLWSTTLTVNGRLRWTQGQLLGSGGSNTLSLRGGGRMAGELGKTIDTVDILIDSSATLPCPGPGVIAEYFQYRVATATTPRMSSISNYYSPGTTPSSGYLPKDFDNSSSIANFARVESTLTRSPFYNGRAPLVFNDDIPTTINSSSPDSFTYNYAVRWTTFVKINTTGDYTFYFLTGYGRPRLWIDGKIVYRGSSYSSFMREQKSPKIRVQSGYRKLRFDYYVISSSWTDRGNTFYVLYEGPNVTKHALRDINLNYCIRNTTTGEDVYVAADPRALSLCTVEGNGLILSRNSNVTVGHNGQLDIRSNVVWYSSAHSSSSAAVHFKNYGILSKTGSVIGSATVCGQYVGKGGRQVLTSGNIDFKSAKSGGCGLAFWNSSVGGRWDDLYNWDPPRVPGKGDLAYVTAAGSYQVIVTAGTSAVISTLIVGGSGSNPQLKIDGGSRLSVLDRMDVYADTTTVNGLLEVSHMTWSGRLLESSSASQGKVVINQSIIILKGVSQNKYLTRIYLINHGNFTVDEAMATGRLYGSVFTLRNLGYLLTVPVYVSVNTKPVEIVNDGTLVLDISTNGLSWYCNVTNTGKVVVFCGSCVNGNSRSWNFNGGFENQGAFIVYMTSVYFQDNNQKAFQGGDIEIWGRPTRRNGFQSAAYGNWSAYVKDIYSGSVIWNVDNDLNLQVYLYSNQAHSIKSLVTKGRVSVTIAPQSGGNLPTVINVQGRIINSENSRLWLKPTSLSPTMILGASSMINANDVIVDKGWTLRSSASVWNSRGRLSILPGANFVVSKVGKTFKVDGQLTVSQQGLFSIPSGRFDVNGEAVISGDFEIGSARGTLQYGMQWTDGTISGRNGRLVLQGQSRIASDYVKTIDGVTLQLEHRERTSNSTDGVVAEFFQYRVATATTPRMTSFNNYYQPGSSPENDYVPQSFDMLTSRPNKIGVLPAMNRFPRVNGNGPLKYQDDGVNIDTSSPDSFTYNYAVRSLAFWEVPISGNYRFFFQTGYGRYRLWIDGKLLKTGNSYSSYLYEQTTPYYKLQAGLKRLRIDYFAISSSWSTKGSMTIVKVEGPGVPKQDLRNLTYAVMNGSSLSYASNFFGDDSTAVCVMEEEGLIIAKNGAGINVTTSGSLVIKSDILWYSHSSLGTFPKIINAGLINKTTDAGLATFYGTYVDAGGQLVKHLGDIEFLNPNKTGGVALWNNSNGGSWLDPNNWIPRRVPVDSDIVYITARGAYTVIITSPSPISIQSLIVGGSSSNPTLFVEHLTSMIVKHRFDMRGDSLELQGNIQADYFVWSGQRILGTPTSFSKAVITARRSFVISQGTQPSKQMTNVEIVNLKNMTVDESMTSKYLYCYGCKVINRFGATIRSYDLYWNGNSNGVTPDNDGFSYGLINEGLVVQISQSGSMNWYWNIRNKGDMIFLGVSYPSPRSVNFQGVFANNGNVKFYAVSPSFNSPKLSSSNGTWEIYGVPARQSNIPSLSWENGGYKATFNYRQYIHDLYKNSTRDVYGEKNLWKGNSVTLSLNSIQASSGTQYISSLQTFGYVRININSYQGARLSIAKKMILSDATLLIMSQSSSSRNNSFSFGKGAEVRLGRLSLISQGWTLRFGEKCSVSSRGDVIVDVNGGIDLSSAGPSVAINGQLIVWQSASVNVTGCRIDVGRSFTLEGRLLLKDSKVRVAEKMRWSRGEISGEKGSVFAEGGLDVFGQYSKRLNGVSLFLGAMQPSSSSGIIAEYFQYRVKTDQTPQRSSLTRFFAGCSSCSDQAPSEFDNPATRPNVARIERSLTREPTYYGSSPLVYSNSGYNVDSSSSDSFTYNYAARFSAFLYTPISDKFTFYIFAGYGQSRIWIDGVKRLTTGTYSSYLRERKTTVFLSKGYHHLRVDNIQTSSSWTFERNLLVVSFSSKCLPKQQLTNKYLSYRRMINGSLVYAAPAYKVLNSSDVCSSGESFSQLKDYDAGVSYGTVKDRGLFETINGSLVSVEKRGVLDIQADISWPHDPSLGNRTQLRILGLAGKSQGSASVKLNTLYDNQQGCTKVDSGSVDFGVAGVLPTIAVPTALPTAASEMPTEEAVVCPTTEAPTTTEVPTTTTLPTTSLPTTSASTTSTPTKSAQTTTELPTTHRRKTPKPTKASASSPPSGTKMVQPSTMTPVTSGKATAGPSKRVSSKPSEVFTMKPSNAGVSPKGTVETNPVGKTKVPTESPSRTTAHRSPSEGETSKVVTGQPRTEPATKFVSIKPTKQLVPPLPSSVPRDPEAWTPDDVTTVLIEAEGGRFSNLVPILGKLTGPTLLRLQKDNLIQLSIDPVEAEAILSFLKKIEIQSTVEPTAKATAKATGSGGSSFGIIVAVAVVGAVLLIAIIIGIVVIRKRRHSFTAENGDDLKPNNFAPISGQQHFHNPLYNTDTGGQITDFGPVSPSESSYAEISAKEKIDIGWQSPDGGDAPYATLQEHQKGVYEHANHYDTPRKSDE